jgi:predicted nucleotidyltransferase
MKHPLTSNEIIEVLRDEKQMLHDKFYVKEIGLFGSYARNEATPQSDIDFLVVIDAPLEIYKQTKEALRTFLKAQFGCEVDLANPVSLKPHFKQRILNQAIYA